MFSRDTSSSKIVLNPLHKTRAFIPKLRYATHGDFPHGRVKQGDLVSGLLGWQDYAIAEGNSGFSLTRLPDPLPCPLTAFMGPLGATGCTAYFGLLDIGQPKVGETVVVSAAAGAVGSVVGQIAKIKGCRVVGITGSDEKCRWLVEELGFDAAINYKTADLESAIAQACPDGIDVYFDNVGGSILDAVLTKINLHARIPLCGLISTYNATEPVPGPYNYSQILNFPAPTNFESYLRDHDWQNQP